MLIQCCRFFEWDRKGKQKRPYFIHFRNSKPTSAMEELELEGERGADKVQEEGRGREEKTSYGGRDVEEKRSSFKEEKEEHVLSGRMLTMAGLFDICTEQEEVGII